LPHPECHPESCCDCKHLSYYDKDGYEDLSPEGWIPCAHRNPGMVNLKSYPFKTKQPCFEPKR
jgi:hypothetical protein